MSLAAYITAQRRLILVLATAFTLAGAAAWALMPRQEDPSFPARNALIVVTLPGADAEEVEERVVIPLEDALSEVDLLEEVNATARTDVAVLSLRLSDVVDQPDPHWDDVRDVLAEVAQELPDAASAPVLQDDIIDVNATVVALYGADPLALREAMVSLEDVLLDVHGVSRVERVADPGRQITVALDDDVARVHNLAPPSLAQALQRRSAGTPTGTLVAGAGSMPVDAGVRFEAVEQVAEHPVAVGEGLLPVRALATVVEEPSAPRSEALRYDGYRAVGLGVVPSKNIDLVRFGDRVTQAVAAWEDEQDGVRTALVSHQPDRVADRLAELGTSLLQGVAIVGGVLFVFMGLRMGGVVATIVPAVTLSSLALYASVGGVLHQMSIAALVLALGLLVDNGIVVAERIQALVDEGMESWAAAEKAVGELALPLASATATTLASFVPLYLSKGPTGDFTRAIPELVMLTLVVSFVAAITLTPTLAAMTFRPSAAATTSAPGRFERFTARLADLPLARPRVVGGLVAALLIGSLALLPMVKTQFFPGSDRNQLVLQLTGTDGDTMDTTAERSRALATALREVPGVAHLTVVEGRAVPRFYYNLLNLPSVPHVAQVLVATEDKTDVPRIAAWSREWAADALPGVGFVAKPLAQGPPLAAPIEIRLLGDDLGVMWDEANRLVAILRAVPGVVDVRHDLAPGAPALVLRQDDVLLAHHGLDRQDVALAMLGRTLGLPAGTLRDGDETVPVRVRSSAGRHLSLAQAAAVDVWSARGPLPLAALAEPELTYGPPAIRRKEGQRTVSVLAETLPGTSAATVVTDLADELEAMRVRSGIEHELGGDLEGSGEANAAIFVAAPVGGVLLLGVLLAQFRSVRKVGLVLLTVPLAAAGVVPGLVIFDQPFGFTSLLGVFSLVGIVVNNAIILLDVVDTEQAAGASLRDAVRRAVVQRTRPILLTTATTVAGLLPLLFSSSTLWPPLASALISGLLASTVLTLLAVPAATVWLLGPRDGGVGGGMSVATAGLAVMLTMGVAAPAHAAEVIDLDDAWQAASDHARELALAREEVAVARGEATRALALLLPKVGGDVGYTLNQEEIVLDIGSQIELPFEGVELPDPVVVRQRDFFDAVVGVQLPLLDPSGIATTVAAQRAVRTQTQAVARVEDELKRGVAQAVYAVWVGQEAVQVAEQDVDLSERQLAVAQAQVAQGMATRIATVEAELAVLDATTAVRERAAGLRTAQAALARLTGLTEVEVQLSDEVLAPSWRGLDEGLNRLRQRPSVREAEAAARAATASRTAAQLSWLPRVDGTFAFTWTENQGFQPDPTYWTLGVRASWNLFEGGARVGRVQTASAQARQAQAAVLLAVEQAEEELVGAWARWEQHAADLEAADQRVSLAQEGQRLAQEAFGAGAGSWLAARDATVRLAEAKTARLAARMAHDLAVLDVRFAVGAL